MATFKNYALHQYRTKEDKAVREELVAAGIPVLELPGFMDTEVKTHYIGLLNGFVFARAWRYWVCTGDMPLQKALEIYDRFHAISVRAEGHAGNIRPEGYCPQYEKALADKMNELKDQQAPAQEVMAELEKIKEAADTPKFVSCYHIDTSEGLKALAEYIQENEIFAHNGSEGSYTASVYQEER